MALSTKYTNTTFSYTSSSTGGLSFIVSDTINNLYPLGTKFDDTVLLNNGSTSVMLNQGSLDKQYLLYHGESYDDPRRNNRGLIPIKYLGACITTPCPDPDIKYFSLTDHETSRQFVPGSPAGYIPPGNWNAIKDMRFILSSVPGILQENEIEPFDWDHMPRDRYDFNGTIIVPNYDYMLAFDVWNSASYRASTYDYTQVEEEIHGDSTKQFYNTNYNVVFTDYNKDMEDDDRVNQVTFGDLWFVFEVEGKHFFVRHPEDVPVDSEVRRNHFIVSNMAGTLDTVKLTIGNIPWDGDPEHTYAFPEDDETKGYSFFYTSIEQQFVRVSHYFITNIAAAYLVNSIGLRWTNTDDRVFNTAKKFRDSVRLGVMGTNGVINHKAWLMNETEIQESTNPNKNTSYDSIPERGSGSGPDTNIDLNPDDVKDTMPAVVWASFARNYLVDSNTMGDVITFVANQASDSLYNKILGVHASFIGITGDGESSQIKIGGIPVTNENGEAVKAQQVTNAIRYLDLGSFRVHPYYNDFRDYLTQYELYLPLVGWVDISPVATFEHNISISLAVDVISGDAQYKLKDTSTGAYIDIIPCTFGFDVPVTSNGDGQLKIARSNAIAGAISTLGQSAVNAGIGAAMGGPVSAVGGTFNLIGGAVHEVNNMMALATTSFANATGVAPYAMIQSSCSPTVVLRVTRVEDYTPEGYGHTTGFVCDKVEKLSKMKGFTVCDNVDCSGIVCTDTEKAMIKTMLESGVYL